VVSSAGKKDSTRSSWSVMSWGVPRLVSVVKYRKVSSPLRNSTWVAVDWTLGRAMRTARFWWIAVGYLFWSLPPTRSTLRTQMFCVGLP